MARRELSDRRKREDTARALCDEASERAKKASEETIKQADIVYAKAKKLVEGFQAQNEATKAHEEAVEQAEKIRHKIEWEAQVVFAHTWAQSDEDFQVAMTKLKESSENAKKVYDEAKRQAELVYEGAKKLPTGTQAKEAEKAYKKALNQAEKDYREAIKSL
jgi:hypothetical protein